MGHRAPLVLPSRGLGSPTPPAHTRTITAWHSQSGRLWGVWDHHGSLCSDLSGAARLLTRASPCRSCTRATGQEQDTFFLWAKLLPPISRDSENHTGRQWESQEATLFLTKLSGRCLPEGPAGLSPRLPGTRRPPSFRAPARRKLWSPISRSH